MQSQRLASADNSASIPSVSSSNRTEGSSDESQAALAIVQLNNSSNSNSNNYQGPAGKNTVTEPNEVGTVTIPLAGSGFNGSKDQGRCNTATTSNAGDMMTAVPVAGGGNVNRPNAINHNDNDPVAKTNVTTAAVAPTTVGNTSKDQGRNDSTLLVDAVADDDAPAEPTTTTTLVATMPSTRGKEPRSVAVHIAGSKCFGVESASDTVRFVDAKGNERPSLGSYPKTPALVRRVSIKNDVIVQEKEQPHPVGKVRKTSNTENGSMLKKPRRTSTAAVVKFDSNSVSTPASRAKARRAKMAAEATKLLCDDQKKGAAAGIDINLTDDDGEPIPVVVSAKRAHNGNYIGASVTVALGGVYDIGRVEGLGDKKGTYWLSVGGRRYLMDREPIDKALNDDEKDGLDSDGGLFAYQTPAKTNCNVAFDAPNTGASMTTGDDDDSWVEDAMGINATPYRQFGWSGVVQATERLLDEEEDPSRRHLHITDESPTQTWSLECLTSPDGPETEARDIAVDGVVTTDETRSIASETTVEYPIPEDDDESKTIYDVAVDEVLDSSLGTSFATAADDEASIITSEDGDEDDEEDDKNNDEKDGDGTAILPKDRGDDQTAIIASKHGDEDEEEEDENNDEKDGDETAILPMDGDDGSATIASKKNSDADFATLGNNKKTNDHVSSDTVQVEDSRPIRFTFSDIHVPSFFTGAAFAAVLQLSVMACIAILFLFYRMWIINEKTS